MSLAPRPSPALRRWLAVPLLVLTILGGVVGLARADDGARWSVRPADGSLGSDRTDLGYTVAGGGRVQDAVELSNPGLDPIRLRLAAAGGVSGWLHLQRGVVTVPGGGSVTVPFVVTPPRDARAGDHVGGIATALDAAGGAQAGPGLPVRLRISGALVPSLAVQGLSTHYASRTDPLGAGSATVTYTVRNTGNVVLSARQAVSVAGPLGTFARRGAPVADSPPLPPGGAWRVTAPLEDVAPAVRLKATVELTPLLADAAGSIAPLASTKTTGHAWSVPWGLLVLVLLALAVVVLAVRLLRRASAPDGARRAAA